MAEQELVIEEAQREDAASLARLLENVALESDFLAQDDRSSILSAEQLATYIEGHQHRLNEIVWWRNWVMRSLVFVMLPLIKILRPVILATYLLRFLNPTGGMVLASFLWKQ